MKIVVLTTETLHHTYFVQTLAREFPPEMVVVERNILAPPFETHHPFEDIRDTYERQAFFGGKNVSLGNVANTLVVGSVNEPAAMACLRKIAPEAVIVFGAGRISKEVIQICPDGIINLHGGDPEEYRGLDSHLWAIYHDDFDSFVVTLHRVNEKLDDGDVILQGRINITKGMRLHELRRHNTELCIRLVFSALDMFKRHRHFISRPQRECGRYYSFMPSTLKDICVVRFRKYAEGVK